MVYTGTDYSMNTRAVPAIALRRSNSASGHYFMSLYTGKRIHGYKWKEIPVDEYVIERVETLAEEEKQPLMKGGLPIFEWGPGEPIDDEVLLDEVLPIVNENDRNDLQLLDENDNDNAPLQVEELELPLVEAPPPQVPAAILDEDVKMDRQ